MQSPEWHGALCELEWKNTENPIANTKPEFVSDDDAKETINPNYESVTPYWHLLPVPSTVQCTHLLIINYKQTIERTEKRKKAMEQISTQQDSSFNKDIACSRRIDTRAMLGNTQVGFGGP